eukprot:1506561-Pyramimonas_sp.AAC.1
MRRPCDSAGPRPDVSVPKFAQGLIDVFNDAIDFGAYETVGMTDGTNWGSLIKLLLLLLPVAKLSPSMRVKPLQATSAI